MNQEAKRPLIPLTLLQTAAKRRWESEGESPSGGFGIGVTRPLCGIQRDGNRKSQGALARSRSGRVCRRQRTAPLCEFPGSGPQAGGLGDEIPHRSPIAKPRRKSSQEAKQNLTVALRIARFYSSHKRTITAKRKKRAVRYAIP